MLNILPQNNNVAPNNMNATENTVYQPKPSGVSIYDIERGRMRHFKNPYGTAAKNA
eukprot:SAG31_NODE_33709_length_340_cov_2.282158_1_plen_55_part_01